jgi:hypothetical protein
MPSVTSFGVFARIAFAIVVSLVARPDLVWTLGCNVGVNVNSFQNFSAAEQETIVQQLVTSGAHCVRTSLRPDDKNIHRAKELQDKGIGLVLVPGAEFLPGAQARPADAKRNMRSALPLSAADPERSRTFYQSLFDKLDANGIVLAGLSLETRSIGPISTETSRSPVRARLSPWKISPGIPRPNRLPADSCNT